MPRKRVAILGGSFDPPTISHLQVASETINLLGFEEVWFIPCGARPDKQNLSAPQHRLAMVRQAVEEFYPPGFPVRVDSMEVDHGPSIPTVYLMDQLEEKYRQTHTFHFIMGSDLIKSLHWWDEGDRIISEMPMIIFRRKGYNNEELFAHSNFPKKDPIVVDEEKSLIGVISSTEIRRRVCENPHVPFKGIAGLVTSHVIDYISKHRLYVQASIDIDLHTADASPVISRIASYENETTADKQNEDSEPAASQ